MSGTSFSRSVITVSHAKSSYVTGREVMTARELGCDHVTVLPASIRDLLANSRLPPHQPDEHTKRFRSSVDEPNLVLAEWSPPDLDVTPKLLAQLAKADPMGSKMQADFKMASTDIDYLTDGLLDECNEKDEETRWRLEDALAVFKKAEDELFEFIAKVQAGVSQ